MMARLVAVPVTADTSLDIVGARNIVRQLDSKEFIQPFLEQFLSRQVDISLYVVRNGPGVLHRKSLGDISPAIYRTRSLISDRGKRGAPVTLAVTATHVFGFRINQSLVREGTVQEILIIVRLSQSLGRAGNAIIVVGILQCFGNRLGFFVERNVTVTIVIRQAIVMFIHCGCLHGFVCPFVIKTFDTFNDHIGQNGYGMVTDHTPGFVTIERPDRKHSLRALIVMGKHGIGDIGVHVLMHQVKPGMQGAIGVPQRESSIIRKAFGLFDILVQSSETTVGILEDERMQSRMISRRIKGLFCLPVGCHTVLFEFLFP